MYGFGSRLGAATPCYCLSRMRRISKLKVRNVEPVEPAHARLGDYRRCRSNENHLRASGRKQGTFRIRRPGAYVAISVCTPDIASDRMDKLPYGHPLIHCTDRTYRGPPSE